MNQKLAEEIQAYLDRYPVEFDWDYRSELSAEQVESILEGKVWEVTDDIYENSLEHVWESEDFMLKEAIDHFDLDIEPSDLHDWVSVPVDINLEGLIRNSSNICIGLDLEMDSPGHAYSFPEYEEVAEELEFWGVNPQDIDPEWPSINGQAAKISAEDLKEAWINAYYSGEWVALLDGREVLEMALKGELEGKEVATLKAGANVTIHDFWNGASSTLHQTTTDIEVNLAKLYNDGGLRYGVQACCGLVTDAWNGQLEPKGGKNGSKA